jgi:hypothetical protein
VEPFLASCCTVAQTLVAVMQELVANDVLPLNSDVTRHIITSHRHTVQQAFGDPKLLAIKNDGQVIMSSLRRDERLCCHSEDYRSAYPFFLLLLFICYDTEH